MILALESVNICHLLFEYDLLASFLHTHHWLDDQIVVFIGISTCQKCYLQFIYRNREWSDVCVTGGGSGLSVSLWTEDSVWKCLWGSAGHRMSVQSSQQFVIYCLRAGIEQQIRTPHWATLKPLDQQKLRGLQGFKATGAEGGGYVVQ